MTSTFRGRGQATWVKTLHQEWGAVGAGGDIQKDSEQPACTGLTQLVPVVHVCAFWISSIRGGGCRGQGGGCGVLNWSQYLVQRWCCWSWGLGTRWRFNTNGIWWSKSVLLGKQSLKNLLKTSSTWRREISNVGGDWSRMKPLYRISVSALIPFHGVEYMGYTLLLE